MFRLEKVFQNDDRGYVILVNLIKFLSVFISFYSTSILYENTIYDLSNYKLYLNSNIFNYSIIVLIGYFVYLFFFKNNLIFKKNFLSFLKEDLLVILITKLISILLILFTNQKVYLDTLLIASSLIVILNLGLLKIYFNYLYNLLIEKNIIQKNIMLIGTYDEIKKILNENFEKIFVFKCCMITNIESQNKKIIKSEIKFPVFKENEDIRSILEYHSLGQIWILNGEDKSKEQIFRKIIKFSVDTLNIKLHPTQNLKGQKLLANKYQFEYFEISRFYGLNLLLKILIDKLLSLFFLIISFPILLVSFILIYLEDGFPLLFTQNRTGWDGRRFKIFKIRSLKKSKFDKTQQVIKDDTRLLKIGKILRRFSIDEIPQLINVLNGDMSIVGPRPHMVEHDIHYSSLFNNFLKRHKCNPGLTGWAQVNGLRGATPNPEIMKRRMEFDLWYLNNWTIFLDVYIIFKTFYAIFKYKGD